ncbi:MAG: alpha-ketoglutarate-dependent taurine dioxygenase [Arenicella sp.]|jgi:alpha-ketoglutarate-dependent taurine dioxygenase
MPNSIQYLADSNQLSFEQGVFPSILAKPLSLISVDDACLWVEHNIIEIEAALARSGALLFRGFPINSAETFDAFSSAFAYSSFTYQESLSNAVRINRTERVFTANEAPKDTEIYLHHEMAQTPISPDKLFFFCLSAAEHGGATPICRSDQLYAALKSNDPELAQQFVDKSLKYTTHMPAKDDQASGQGRSWKSTLSVENKEQAENKLRELGYSWSWQTDTSLRATTPILPAVRTLTDGTQVFYNQLVAAYMGWEGVRQNPSKAITFGDGTAIPAEGLKCIVEMSTQYTYDIQWQDGDVALIDNKTTMHGRRPYSGERKREVLVALAAQN